MKIFTLFVAFTLVCFALSPSAQGVVPPPPGGYPNFTTAAGDHALQALTLGLGNTAIGTFSLFSVTAGNYNTAVGAGSLDLNLGDFNTATGAAALLFNTTGTENTANGTAALEFNHTGTGNTANGAFALYNNDITGAGLGKANTAVGATALFNNTDGDSNNAVGFNALGANEAGLFNNAMGFQAMADNVSGAGNVAVGDSAGAGVEGDFNIYIGAFAGPTPSPAPVAESETIRIGDVFNVACFIGGIDEASVDPGTGVPVFVDVTGKLGTVLSSKRFKDAIKPIDKASEAILALQPVTFRYKKELDPKGIPQFGLIAEDVAKVNPNLVVRDRNGAIQTVRYEAVNAMLLNEFLKEHRKVEKLEATVERQHKDFEAAVAELKGQIQKVSAQIELNKPAPQTVLNSH